MLRLSRRRRVRGADASEKRGPCTHLVVAADAPEPKPAAMRCQDCAQDGEHSWAHLRMCVTCGHVGCCDSSPKRHATTHYEQTGHPVMRSIEPGESWRWCYVDLELLA